MEHDCNPSTQNAEGGGLLKTQDQFIYVRIQVQTELPYLNSKTSERKRERKKESERGGRQKHRMWNFRME